MKRVFVNRTGDYYRKLREVREGIENELTISHVLKSKNAFTGSGLSYGEILSRKLGVREGMRILEVGPGLGDLAEDLCKNLEDFHYTFLDISSAFMNSLKSRFTGDRFSFVTGDLLSTEIRDRFDLVICNEVLADLPTILNMRLGRPSVDEEDKETYYDALALAKVYGLKARDIEVFNYGAVKFIEKAKSLLREGGKVFVCEHSSEKPRRLRVYGHSEFTINFRVLEAVAERLGFRTRKGSLTNLMGIKKKKAVLLYTQPELKTLYNFFKRQGIFFDQRAYQPEEIVKMLGNSGVGFSSRKVYLDFLKGHSKPLNRITDQFKYLILETPEIK